MTDNLQSDFYDAIRKYFSSPETWQEELTEDRIKEIVADIRVLNVAQHQFLQSGIDYFATPHQWYYLDKYELSNETLIIKNTFATDYSLRVLPSEHCFKLIDEVHTGNFHCTKKEIVDAIMNTHKLEVPEIYIDIYLSLCVPCKGRAIGQEDEVEMLKFNDCIRMNIIDMTDHPDQSFKYLLHYEDKATKFTIMRPLIDVSTNKVGMELLKIFMNYGTPQRIEVVKASVVSIKVVLKQIAQVYSRIHTEVVGLVSDAIQAETFLDELKQCVGEEASRNWAFTCSLLQYEINKKSSNGNSLSPIEAVFNF